MKNLTKIALGASITVMLLAAAAPAFANCGSAFALPTPGYINIPGSGNYTTMDPIPNFTPNSKVTFWSLTSGDAALLAGDDSGSYTIYLRNSIGTAASLPYDYSTGTTMVADGAGPFYNYSMTFNTNWGANGLIDGCIDSIPATGDRCTCVLVQDQWQGESYFAVLSSVANPVGDFSWSGAGMGDLPTVRINDSGRAGNVLNLQTNLNNITGGINNNGCDCTPTGYKIYQQSVATTGDATTTNAPVNRDKNSGWTEIASGNLGDPDVAAAVDCTGNSTDVYLGATLTWAGGFETDIVSANTTKVACDPNLADPSDPVDLNRPKVRPSKPLRPVRGERSR